MFIVINCLGMPFNGSTINDTSLGGSETAAYYVAKELATRGHRVSIYTNMRHPENEQGIFDNVRYIWAGDRTEEAPLGERFHFFAENTPHDVLIIQRAHFAFRFKFASKVNLWWVHDLPTLRIKQEVSSQLWNIDGILTVSEFHKKQYERVYGVNPDIVLPIQNGVDINLFEENNGFEVRCHEIFRPINSKEIKLLYTSRPERGLEHLVSPGGLMERFLNVDKNIRLYVCGYDNVTEPMAGYYSYLWDRVKQLSNCSNLGSLTKQQLADVMRKCDILVYPTPGPKCLNFDEVSCITAMECMAAGLPMITSNRGALPETCQDSGTILVNMNEDGSVNLDNFFSAIVSYIQLDNEAKQQVIDKQLSSVSRYTWDKAVDKLETHITNCFIKNRSKNAIVRELIRNSDIYALNEYIDCMLDVVNDKKDLIIQSSLKELQECYSFAFEDSFYEHYEAYYQYEKERGVNYGPETLAGNGRYDHVAHLCSNFDSGSYILDYGCAHGHYTINLAKRYPEFSFVGVDIVHSNIETAKKWANEEGVGNVQFFHGHLCGGKIVTTGTEVSLDVEKFDCIIAAEIIEHIENPKECIETLNGYLKNDDSLMIITTPYGPWEAQGYEEHYPWRAHLWHFDRADLSDLFGAFPNFKIVVAPAGSSKWVAPLGSYITTWNKFTNEEVGVIDYNRKFEFLKPIQTVSTCMIVKNGETTLRRCLDSIVEFSNEIIIGVDKTTTDRTKEVIEEFVIDLKRPYPVVTVINIDSPLKIGFDEVRNKTVEKAVGDWIFWIDADEILINPQNVFKYLRNNQFDGYAVKQHHYTAEPLGVLKTDLPCRFFRNHRGVRFYGVVHEHPEVELNKGVGFVQLIPDFEIAHQGYTTEEIRRFRFKRNIPLLTRDREKYPDRKLGKFLWFRDLAQMCKYELEANGGRVTPDMKERAKEGIKIWEELLEIKELRMILDGMEFYNTLALIQGESFEYSFVMDSSKSNGGINLNKVKPVHANFATKDHLLKLLNAVVEDKVQDYEEKYY